MADNYQINQKYVIFLQIYQTGLSNEESKCFAWHIKRRSVQLFIQVMLCLEASTHNAPLLN